MNKISDYISYARNPKQQKAYQYVGKGKFIFYGGARGGGKLSPLHSKVCTPKGWKKIGEIKVGDTISDPVTGGTTKVIQIHPQGKKDIYKVTFDDGASCLVGLEHLWAYKRPNHIRPNTKKSSEREYAEENLGAEMPQDQWSHYRIGTTEELITLVRAGERPRIPLTKPVIYTVNGRTGKGLDPYLCGLLLGDGHIDTYTITNEDKEIRDYLISLGFTEYGKDSDKCNQYRAAGEIRKSLQNWVYNNKLEHRRSWEKFIPKYVLTSSLKYRTEFVQGLMDSDGYVDERGRCYYCTTSDELAKGVIDIIRSLGGKTYDRIKYPKYTHNGEKKDGRPAHDILIQLPRSSALFRLSRKKDRCTDSWNGGHEMMRAIVSIEYHSHEEAQCITVSSPNGLYITDDFIVTHNSHFALTSGILVAMQFPGIRVVIMRRHYSELNELFIQRLMENYPEDIFGYNFRKQDRTAYFQNKSKIIFRAAERDTDVQKVQGLEYQYMIVDEANQFYPEQLEMLLGSLRNAGIKNFTSTFLMTGNPGGFSDVWFKTHFITPDYKYWTKNSLKNKHKYIFIPASVYDNPYIEEDYIDNLKGMGEDRKRAWLDGDWNVFTGQYFSEWNEEKHVVKPFEIPKHWRTVGGLDLGFSKEHPTVFLLSAQDPDTGRLYITDEYVDYGVLEQYVRGIGGMLGDKIDQVREIYADPSMWGASGRAKENEQTSEQIFTVGGLPLLKANNKRVEGWRILKQWLHWDKRRQVPFLQVFENCRTLIDTLPLNKYNNHNMVNIEDLDTRGPDDAVDALRYIVASAFGYPLNSIRHVDIDIPEQHSGIDYEAMYDTNYETEKKYEDNGIIEIRGRQFNRYHTFAVY